MKIHSIKDFIQSPVALTDDASSVLMACCLSNKFDRADPELDAIPIVKIVKNNASRRGLTITNGAALLIALTCSGNAGSAISMLHAMNLQRLRRAYLWANQNYLAYAQAQSAETRVPVGDLIELWNNRSTDYDLRAVDDTVVQGHQAVADAFLQLGVLDGPAQVAPLWDRSFKAALGGKAV